MRVFQVLLSGSIFFFIVLVTTLLVSFILPNSNFWLLFIFYLAFAMSILSFCYLISNLLQSNATLAALTGKLHMGSSDSTWCLTRPIDSQRGAEIPVTYIHIGHMNDILYGAF